jgi:hypothetical protein
MRIDRDDYVDKSGKAKYRNQPRTDDIIKITSDIHNDRRHPIAFTTSGVYAPSRRLSVALAGLKLNRSVNLVAYGNKLVNEVRGTDLAAPLNQLPGELHRMAEIAVDLEAELKAA